ncbi:MAG: hypothetical protein HZB26_04205 [Candidatus Hydrogenedentes bacterium]|nr:hypothetical protein [Candidatus Hydrogenedentota bacterium]
MRSDSVYLIQNQPRKATFHAPPRAFRAVLVVWTALAVVWAEDQKPAGAIIQGRNYVVSGSNAGSIRTSANTGINPPSIHSASGAWPIRRQWTRDETLHYAQWVEHVFEMKTRGSVEQRTAKLERVLTDPEMNLLEDTTFRGEGSNPQLSPGVIRTMHGLMDCAKFTAFMPAYYAYRRGLPWMTSAVASGHGDIRTSESNTPVGCVNSFTSGSPGAFFMAAVGGFISGNYRVNIDGKNAGLSDTVPVAINRTYLTPGCINYVDGHCLLLSRVTEYGELCFLNCSTTATRDIFSYNGMNTVTGITPRGTGPESEWNGCFQGLRVLRYPIAITDASGLVLQVRRRTDEEMKEFGFSTEEYDIAREITDKHYITEGALQAQSLHDFIRLRMKSVDRITPLKFMEAYANEILEAYTTRELFVQDAWREVRSNGPIVYPENRTDENIFQANGRWEAWSSPSSDVDRRNKYFYLADWLEYAIRMYGVIPQFLDLAGLDKYNVHSQSDLAKAFLAEKKRIFEECGMTYTNSKGGKVHLTLLDIEQRLYDMSFDPNHPPELRWGAPIGSEERALAPNTYTPTPDGARVAMEDAYKWEAYYRCLGERETDVSCLTNMFTTGFPIRDKLDAQVGKWIVTPQPAIASVKAAPEKLSTTTSTPQSQAPYSGGKSTFLEPPSRSAVRGSTR